MTNDESAKQSLFSMIVFITASLNSTEKIKSMLNGRMTLKKNALSMPLFPITADYFVCGLPLSSKNRLLRRNG